MLQLNKDNQFRILVIADIQVWIPLSRDKQSYIRKLIQTASPDLIVLLGDMVCGPLMLTKRRIHAVIHSILEPIWESGIPYTFISGNHDQDARMSLEDQIHIYRENPNCITPLPSDRDCKGAYVVEIMNNNNKIAKLLFIDNGATQITLQGVQYFPADKIQLDYTQRLLQEETKTPIFIFQHVPVPEIYQLIEVKDAFSSGSVRGHGPYRGKYLSLKKGIDGILGEAPCPSWTNTQQYVDWKNSRKVAAAIFGHDHKNSFTGEVGGVSFVQVSCAGLTCYGTDSLRGGQLLTLYSNGEWSTKPLYYRDIM